MKTKMPENTQMFRYLLQDAICCATTDYFNNRFKRTVQNVATTIVREKRGMFGSKCENSGWRKYWCEVYVETFNKLIERN